MPAGRQRNRALAAAAKQRQHAPRRVRLRSRLLRTWRSARSWPWVVASAAVVAGLAALLLVLLLGGNSRPTVDNGRYLAFTGCLLTDARGLSAQPAAAAWAGLEQVASATRMQAQYLEVPASASTAGPYLASLLVRHCDVVVAAGAAQAAAVQSESRRYRGVKFVVVGGSASGQNVVVARGTATALTSRVAADVTAYLRALD